MTDPAIATAEKLLHGARELFRGPAFAPGFRAASDAYEAALAAIPQIPERQRKNVYEQSMYAQTHSRIPLAERIDAAIRRETTRTARIAERGLRVETVESWVRKIVEGEIVTTVDVEVYDAETGELWTNRENVLPEFAERVAADLYVRIVNGRAAEDECDECYVFPDGSRQDGGTCLCSLRRPANGCRCKEAASAWHGPTFIRAEIAAEEV